MIKRHYLILLWVLVFCINCAVHAADMTATLKDNTSSSGFSIVNASGTITARFRGDGNVGIGTTTPSSRLMIVGSSTSSSDASLIVMPGGTGEILYVRNDRRVGINTGSPTTELQVIGTITATYFSGNGSALTGITSSSSTNSVNSATIIDGSITGADLASNISISTTGTMSVASGNFVVDINGSMTATTINSTGTLTAAGNLTVNGTVTISGNRMITSSIATNTYIGVGAGNANTTGYSNAAYGYQALYSNTTGAMNTANGYQALYSNTTGNRNTANGYQALYANTTGDYNTANGEYALANNTTGSENTANGYQALSQNTAGGRNTANGWSALNYNTTGVSNTANGYMALAGNTTGNYNTVNGDYALSANSIGSYNTANGDAALRFNISGNYNTAIGYAAGYSTTGSSSVFLGNKAGYNETGSNKLYIANSDTSTLIYGDFSTSKVGIGTTTPATTLYVIGTVTATGFIGDGSQLTGITATVGANSVSSSTIVDGSITGSDMASTLSMSTKSLDIGSITVNAGNFRVDSNGSITATMITSTGSITASAITTTGTLTASGNLNIDSGTLFVDAANNRVGIGATSPQTKLEVVGDANTFIMRSPTASSYGSFRIYNDQNSGSRALEIGYGGSSYSGSLLSDGSNGETAYLTTTGSYAMQFGTANFMRMLIDSSGNVGIGTSTPQTKLHVVGAVTVDGNVIGRNGTLQLYGAGLDGSNLQKSVVYVDTTNGMLFEAPKDSGGNKLDYHLNWRGGGTDGLTIKGTGNVGIGTTTPSTALVVIGTVTATQGFVGDGSQLTGIAATSVGANSVNSSSIVDGSIASADLASNISISTTGTMSVASGNFVVDSAGSMTASTVNSSGTITANGNLIVDSSTLFVDSVNNRVGIGTTTPQSALAVVGTVTISGNKLITWTDDTTNTFLGVGAGGTSTAGTQNTACGYQTLYSNNTGSYNSAYGWAALRKNNTGNFNTAYGVGALTNNTSGAENTANGYQALVNNTIGSYNVANGLSSLFNNTTGNNNTANGYKALAANNTGSNNTALGYQAGYSATITNYSNNVFLGYKAGYNETGSNKLYIANSDTTTLIYGDFSTSKVGIGTTTPSTTLHVVGTITATGFVGNGSQLTGISASVGTNSVSSASITDGSVSSADIADSTITGSDLASSISISTTGTMSVASGNFVVDSAGSMTASSISTTGTLTVSGKKMVTFAGNTTNTHIGVGAGSSTTTGYNNTAYGYEALKSNTTGYHNTANGYQALYSNTIGYVNTANGWRALYSNTSGNYNIAIGEQALYSNTSGGYNIAIGYEALYYNTTGTRNTASGFDALQSNTSGYQNTANGAAALSLNTGGLRNTANGHLALYSNTIGNYNTANGYNALYTNSTGNNNTAIGCEAGYSASGNSGVFLGYQAGYNETGSNKLHIANSSSSTLIYGDFSTSKVGIGTTTPSTALVVIGTVTATQGFVGNGSQLTGISASVGTNSVSSASITDGSVSSADIADSTITGSDLASSISISTTGTMSVASGNFVVDSAGSMTASNITSTGSVTASAITTTGTLTASGNLNIDSGTLFVNSANNRVGIGTTTPQTAFAVSGTATVTNGYFGIGTNNPGARLTIHTNGIETASGGLGITDGTSSAYITMIHTGSFNYVTANAHVFYNASSTEIFRATSDLKMGIGTETPQTKLHVIGTVTATGFVGNGSQLTGISATSIGADSVSSSSIVDGSITGSDLAGTLNMTTQAMNIGSITVNAGSFRVDSAGSMTASAITSTGTMTIGGAVVRNTGIVLGTGASTHVNLGVSSTTGTTTADANYATVGGGFNNTASGDYATVGGGYYNTASGDSATVGGGGGDDSEGNVASGNYATVGGGNKNTASGDKATVGGGEYNTASGPYATVGGGYYNTAAGDYSWAGGWDMQLTANADNTFVWGTATSAFSIDTADGFLIFPNATGETGRVGIGTSTPSTKLVVVGTITATGFVGNGSQLTGISATVGADSVSSSSIVNGTIVGADLASNISISTTGTMSVASGGFVVDSNGSITATTITSTGSVTATAITTTGTVTASGNLAIDFDTLFVDSVNNRVGIGINTPQSTLHVVGTVTVSGNKIITNSEHTTNTFLGLGAGNSTTWDTENGGTGNTANGYRALYSNTYGAYNTANGCNALYTTTGSDNTANGFKALFSNNNSSNTAMGSYALYSNTTGYYNMAVGAYAGYSNTTGIGNVFLGYEAGYNETGSNKLHIANSSSSTLIYGDFTNTRVGIGTTTPSTTLVVAGTVTATGGDIRVIGGSFIDDGTTLTVPDYVFDSDYYLKPLTQVKAYIQGHKHLEGVPDMNDKKGWASLSMQDRDMKLLEKIEELTLYLIQMKEENDAMKARILALETNRMGETCPEPCKVGNAHPTELVKWAKFTQQIVGYHQ